MGQYVFGLSGDTSCKRANFTNVKKSVTGNLVCPSSSRGCYVCTLQGFVTKQLHDLHHLDELKNFAANILFQSVIKLRTRIRAISQSRTGSCALKKRDCHYRISPIGYWGKGSTIGWYKVLRFLVTACFDNSKFSGVVTLKSPGEIFCSVGFSIHKQITRVKFIFCCI